MNERPPKKPVTPGMGAFAGALVGALVTVHLGQRSFEDVAASMPLTLAVLGVGAVVGGVVGYLVIARRGPSG